MIPQLTEQIRPRTSQINNLGATISILLEPRALEAVKRVRDSFAATDDAFILVVSERAFIADAHERGGADVGVADGAFAVAFVAEAADGDAWLLAAHDEIGVMARHGGGGLWIDGGRVRCGEVVEEMGRWWFGGAGGSALEVGA